MKSLQKLKTSNLDLQIKYYFSLFLIFTLAYSCTFQKYTKRIHSEPYWKVLGEKNNTKEKKVVVAIINSLQGNIFSQKERYNKAEIKNGKLISHTFDVGGGAILSSYLDILKKRYKENLILLDTGNIFKSPTSIDLNETTLKVYESLDLDAISFTSNEVRSFSNLKRSELDFKKMNLPFTNNNIISLKTRERIKRKGLAPYRIVKLGNMRAGIVSLDFIAKNMNKNDKNTYYQDPIFSFLKLKKKLKKENIHFLILMANLKSNCISKKPFEVKMFKDREEHTLNCKKEKDPLKEFVNRLPPHSVDLIITSTSKFGSGFINDIPIVQIPGEGKFLGRAEFAFNNVTKKLISKKTAVYPAIKLCHKFFLKTEDCFLFQNNQNVGKGKRRFKLIKKSLFQLMPAKYLGYEVKENLALKEIIHLTNK